MLARLYLAALAFSCLSSEVQSIPLPPEIQKLICKFAGMKSLEDSTVEKLCEKAQELFPSLKFDPDCKTVVEELWDTGLAVFCPEPSQVGVTALPVPPFLEKLVCQAASRKEVENSTVEAVCAKVHEVFPQAQFDPDCETVMDEFWEAGLALCPASREAAMPSPQDIGRLICEVASAEEIEDHAVDAVCAKITAVFPSLEFDPDCKTMLEEIWDSAEAMCPKRRERALPSPEELEKLICEVASSKEIENHAVEAVCAKIVAEFPKIKFVPECKTMLEEIWDSAEAMCPTRREQAMPSPEELEKLICEVASSKEIEEHAVEAVCAKIVAEFPKIKFVPDCKTMLEEIWDSAEAMCPKRRERALPSPEELEKLICEVASSKEIEEHAVEAVCAKIVAEFPKIKFVPDCNNALDSIWDAVVAKCPHSRSTAEIVV